MANGQYRIVEAQLPLIGGVAGHNFLVLLGPNGELVGELHGMARDVEGNIKAIGNVPDDRLKSAEYPGDIEKHPFYGPVYRPHFAQAQLASGDQATIMNLWNVAKAAAAKMDEQDIQYPWNGLGRNSNSFASTLIAAMGLNEPSMPGGAPITPGARSMLLEPKSIQDIQRQFNIGAPSPGDATNTPSQPDAADQPSQLDSARRPLGPAGAPSDRATAPSVGDPRSRATPQQVLPSMAVPGAKGPTSLGGPDGPAPLVPSVRSRSQAPASAPPTADPTLPPLQFAPELPRSWGPFTVPLASPSDAPNDADGTQPPATAGATRRLTSIYPEVGPLGRNLPGWRSGSDTSSGLTDGQPNAPSLAPVWTPPEALLGPDRNRAASDWVKPLPFNQAALPAQDAPGGIPGLLMQVGAFDPSHADDPPAGGLLRLIQDYMRNNPDRDTTR